jgi:hypothetical protein
VGEKKKQKKLRIEGICFNLINKSIANIIVNEENLKAFPLKSGMRCRCLHIPLLLNIEFKLSARPIRQEKEKEIQLRKEKVKLPLLADDTILYLKDPKRLHQKILRSD